MRRVPAGKPRAELEQYPTPPNIASAMLLAAHEQDPSLKRYRGGALTDEARTARNLRPGAAITRTPDIREWRELVPSANDEEVTPESNGT